MARTVHEWKTAGKWILASAIAIGLLQGAVWYVGDSGDTSSLHMWQSRMLWVIGINLIIAVSYTIWPKQPKSQQPKKETTAEAVDESLTRR